MENLSTDALIHLALNMEIPALINLCNISGKINAATCNNSAFWKLRLNKDYNITDVPVGQTNRTYYNFINQQLISEIDINNVLLTATQANDLNLVKAILKTNPNINLNDALKLLISNNNMAITKYLLDNGAKINNNNNDELLTLSIRTGNLNMIKLLVTHGLNTENINEKDIKWATDRNYADIVHFLGQDPRRR